jgi:hypothetical protein
MPDDCRVRLPHDGQREPAGRGKLAACRYFYRWELPRIDRWLRLLELVDPTTLDAAADWFS